MADSGVIAAAAPPRSAERSYYAQSVILPALPDELIRTETENKGERQRRIGLNRPLPTTLEVGAKNWSEWRSDGRGKRTYSVLIAAPGAQGMRIHFEAVHMPPGARVTLSDAARPDAAKKSVDVPPGGSVWSPTIFAETVAVECEVPPGVDPARVRFTIPSISQIYAKGLESPPEGTVCADDLACHPEYREAASAVGLLTFVSGGDTYICTGALVHGSGGSRLFVTANHCIYNRELARSIEVYWLYEAGNCGGAAPDLASVPATTGGGELLANASEGDFAVLRLTRTPPGSVGALAWSLDPLRTGEQVVCIHHPEGGPKRISFGNTLAGEPSYWPVQWYSGVTQHGSSGSPLLNARGELVGVLNGGYDGPGSSCDQPDAPDQFGRFDLMYAGASEWFSGTGGGPPSLAKAIYSGLFQDPAGIVEPGSAGMIAIKTTATGKFSGQVWISGKKSSFTGRWDSAGQTEVLLKRKQASPMRLLLQVAPEEPGTIYGQLSDEIINAEVAAYRVGSRLPGQYTLLIAGNSETPELPSGESYGSLKVDASGRARFAGSLADGTKVTQGTYLTEADLWGLSVPVYRGSGLLFGWIGLGDGPEERLGGDVVWNRPQWAGGSLYPDGFYFETYAEGAAYHPPSRGESLLPAGEAWLVLVSPEETLENPVGIGPGNRVTNYGAGKLSLKFATATGLFSGTLADPTSGIRFRLGGAVIQPDGSAYGYFLDGLQAGEVMLGP